MAYNIDAPPVEPPEGFFTIGTSMVGELQRTYQTGRAERGPAGVSARAAGSTPALLRIPGARRDCRAP
jgi:hypothetical protein